MKTKTFNKKRPTSHAGNGSGIIDQVIDEMNSKRNREMMDALHEKNSVYHIIRNSKSFDKEANAVSCRGGLDI